MSAQGPGLCLLWHYRFCLLLLFLFGFFFLSYFLRRTLLARLARQRLLALFQVLLLLEDLAKQLRLRLVGLQQLSRVLLWYFLGHNRLVFVHCFDLDR